MIASPHAASLAPTGHRLPGSCLSASALACFVAEAHPRPPRDSAKPSRRPLALVCAISLAVAAGCGDSGGLRIFAPSSIRDTRVISARSSAFLGGRQLWIYLPQAYSSTVTGYPVLYVLDGEFVFSPTEPSWHAEQMLDSMALAGIPPLIVVAIESARSNRASEYSPWPDIAYGGGGGDHFLQEVRVHLKPVIDRAFRTDADRTYLLGTSLGGLLAVYAGYTHSDTFRRIAAMSPSYWWGYEYIVRYVEARGRSSLERFYQDTGARFDNSPLTLTTIHSIAVSQGFHDTIDLMTVIDSLGVHGHAHWQRRFPAAIEFLVRGRNADVSGGTGG